MGISEPWESSRSNSSECPPRPSWGCPPRPTLKSVYGTPGALTTKVATCRRVPAPGWKGPGWVTAGAKPINPDAPLPAQQPPYPRLPSGARRGRASHRPGGCKGGSSSSGGGGQCALPVGPVAPNQVRTQGPAASSREDRRGLRAPGSGVGREGVSGELSTKTPEWRDLGMFRDPQSQASSATAPKKFPVQSARTVQPGPERGERAGPRPSLGGTPSGAERRGGPGGGDPATTYLEFPIAWRLRLWCARDTPSRLHSGRRLRAGLRASISHRVSPTWRVGQPRPGTPPWAARRLPGSPGLPRPRCPQEWGARGAQKRGSGRAVLSDACARLASSEFSSLGVRGGAGWGVQRGPPQLRGAREFLSFLLRGRSKRWVGAHGGCWPGPAGREGSPSRHHHHHHPRESGLPLAIAGSSVGSGSTGGAAGSFSLFLGLALEAARFGSARLAPGLERR